MVIDCYVYIVNSFFGRIWYLAENTICLSCYLSVVNCFYGLRS